MAVTKTIPTGKTASAIFGQMVVDDSDFLISKSVQLRPMHESASPITRRISKVLVTEIGTNQVSIEAAPSETVSDAQINSSWDAAETKVPAST